MIYKEGGHGDVVKLIQRPIGAVVDGVWGKETTAKLILWQRKNGLVSDGIAGPKTLKALGVVIPGSETPAAPAPVIVDPLDQAAGVGPNPFKRGSPAFYEFLYKGLVFDKGREAQILAATKVLLGQKSRAFPMEQKTRVPWPLLGSLNIMEGGGGFDKYLGNGQSIHRVTTIVPKGRGPFPTWEDGVMDALKIDGLLNVLNWSLGLMLKYAEQFNGTGYLLYHHNSDTPRQWPFTSESPYIFSCSNINDGTGKYTSDGHYDANADANKQVGVATMLKQMELMGEFKPTYTT